MATHWAAKAFIISQERWAVLAVHWSQFLVSVQPLAPPLPWRDAGHDTVPAVGRHVPFFLSTFVISLVVALINKTFFIRVGHIVKTPNFSFVKKEMKYQWNLPFCKENKGLQKAGDKWDLANTWPLRRFLYRNMLCSWCNVQLQALHTTDQNALSSFCQRGVCFTCLETERNISLS